MIVSVIFCAVSGVYVKSGVLFFISYRPRSSVHALNLGITRRFSSSYTAARQSGCTKAKKKTCRFRPICSRSPHFRIVCLDLKLNLDLLSLSFCHSNSVRASPSASISQPPQVHHTKSASRKRCGAALVNFLPFFPNWFRFFSEL